MSQIRKLPKPVHLIEMTYERLVKKWFEDTYCTKENRAKIDHDETLYNGTKRWKIRALVPSKAPRGFNEVNVGQILIHQNGSVQVLIEGEYGYLFDDALAIYRKMELS